MQKHHWYLIVGFLLAFPLWFLSLHGAGIGVMLAGTIDWIYSALNKS